MLDKDLFILDQHFNGYTKDFLNGDKYRMAKISDKYNR